MTAVPPEPRDGFERTEEALPFMPSWRSVVYLLSVRPRGLQDGFGSVRGVKGGHRVSCDDAQEVQDNDDPDLDDADYPDLDDADLPPADH